MCAQDLQPQLAVSRQRPVRATTLSDVARQVGVSISTVSRVLSGNPNVQPATRERVFRVANELGYTANSSARALVTQRTNTLGVIFPDINNEFFRSVLSGINDATHEAGRQMMVSFGMGADHEPRLVNEYLFGGRVDALILLNLGLPEPFLREVARAGTPMVLVGRPVPGAEVATILLENVGGADAAMTHLLEHGYRRIAVLRGPEDNFDAQQRWRGCRRALRRAGVELDEALIWQGGFFEPVAHAVVGDWLDRHDPPEAILALNDAMAIGALHVLREHGLAVPQDVALMGFDDSECAAHLGLATVRCPLRELGQHAVRAALNLLGTQDPPAFHRQTQLPTELVVRPSCGCQPPRPQPAARAAREPALI